MTKTSWFSIACLCAATSGVAASHARAVVQLSAPAHSTAQAGTVEGYSIGGTGEHVVFKMRNAATGRSELYSRRLDGTGDVARISDGASTMRSGVDEFAVSPDGQYVVYESGGLADFQYELYGRRIDGAAAPVRLTPRAESNQFTPLFRFLPHSGHDLVWLHNAGTTESDRLYALPADGSAAPRQVSPVFPYNGWRFSGFDLTAGGARALYQARVGGNIEIYSSDVASPDGAPLKHNDAATLQNYSHFAFKATPDGQRVVWTGDDSQLENPLWSRPLDNSLPAVQIGAYKPGTGRQPFRLSPDSTRAAYVSPVNAQVDRLYSTPLDGSAAPQKLTDWEVKQFAFTPDGSRLVYVADTDNDQFVTRPYSLFSRDVLGAGSEKELYRSTGEIKRFETVGERVYFFGSGSSVWSAPVDGSSPASELARVPAGTIMDFVFSPDGQYVLLPVTTDWEHSFAELLYAARTDGSVAPWQVNHDLVGADATVRDFSFAPDGVTVIYQASDVTTAGFELYSTKVPEPSAAVGAAALAACAALRRRRRTI